MFFSIKKDIYDKKVLLKTCYKFTDEYYIHLDSNKDEFVISIQKKDGKADTSIEGEFKNELIEFANREISLRACGELQSTAAVQVNRPSRKRRAGQQQEPIRRDPQAPENA